MTNIAAIQRDRLRAALDAYSEVVAEREAAKRTFTNGDHSRAMTDALAAADQIGGPSAGRALRKLNSLRGVLVAQQSQVAMALGELDNIVRALAESSTPVTRADVDLRPPNWPGCRCVEDCASDPATACSLSGEPHVHPDDGLDTFGRCPQHPDAPGDL